MFRKKHVEMESWFSGRKLRLDLAPREIGFRRRVVAQKYRMGPLLMMLLNSSKNIEFPRR